MKGNLVMTAADNLAFEQSMGMLERSILDLKKVATNLIPADLFQRGLDLTLRESCMLVNQLGQIEISYESVGVEDTTIEASHKANIYLLIQSLINHAITERLATQVSVLVDYLSDQINIHLTDNGKQMSLIDMEAANWEDWRNLQKRVAILKGKIDIHSVTDNRFSIDVEIKL